MTSARAITVSAGTQALFTVPWTILGVAADEYGKAFLAAAGVVINRTVTELPIRRRCRRRIRRLRTRNAPESLQASFLVVRVADVSAALACSDNVPEVHAKLVCQNDRAFEINCGLSKVGDRVDGTRVRLRADINGWHPLVLLPHLV